MILFFLLKNRVEASALLYRRANELDFAIKWQNHDPNPFLVKIQGLKNMVYTNLQLWMELSGHFWMVEVRPGCLPSICHQFAGEEFQYTWFGQMLSKIIFPRRASELSFSWLVIDCGDKTSSLRGSWLRQILVTTNLKFPKCLLCVKWKY